MKKALIAATLALCATSAAAQSGAPTPVQREIIPGSELMTHQERERYRQRMGAARNTNEQAQVRDGHVKQMRERARLRGLALPETLPPEKK